MTHSTPASLGSSQADRTARLIEDVNYRFGDHADSVIRDTLGLRRDVTLTAFTESDLDAIDALLRRAWIVDQFLDDVGLDEQSLDMARWATDVSVLQVAERESDDFDLPLFDGLRHLGFVWLPPRLQADPYDWRIVRRQADGVHPISEEAVFLITHQIEHGEQHVGWLAIKA